MIELRLPDVGEGLEEAEVVRWLVAAGERVARDQPIVEIQTDKALVEIPAPAAGTVSRLAVEVGAIVKVGDLLFVLDGDGAGARAAASIPAGDAGGAEAAGGAAAVPAARPEGEAPRLRPRAAPTVRKLALELGVDLAAVAASGPGGRVLAEDVERAAAGSAAARAAAGVGSGGAAAPGGASASDATPAVAVAATRLPSSPLAPGLGQALPGRIPIAGVRRVIAQTMTQSWTTIPHIHGHDELDALPLVEALRGLRRRAARRAQVLGASEGDSSSQLTLAVLFVLAAARALRRFPLVNASIDAEANAIVVHEEVNVGLAVATPVGLIVPVVRSADRLGLWELAAEIDRLARAARERKVKPEELRGGTFTVTNFGSLGGRFANPIIRPPEVGILGFGAIRERPWAVGSGRIEARPVLPISFGADHRLIDGDLSVAFQEHVRELLSDPVHLLLGE